MSALQRAPWRTPAGRGSKTGDLNSLDRGLSLGFRV